MNRQHQIHPCLLLPTPTAVSLQPELATTTTQPVVDLTLSVPWVIYGNQV
jgi:hypothetical protein